MRPASTCVEIDPHEVTKTRSTTPPIRSHKVHPLNVFNGRSELIEVRPNRTLRVYHSRRTTTRNAGTESENKYTGNYNESSSGGNSTLTKTDEIVPSQPKPPDNPTTETQSKKQDATVCMKSDLTQETSIQESLTEQPSEKESNSKRSRTASSIRCHIATTDNHNCTDVTAENDTVIFLLHGVGGSVEVWSCQIYFFEKLNYEIVAMDFIGHGQSSSPLTPEAYTFKEISEDALAVFDRFRKTRNIIVGHSYGCCFSTLLARFRSRFITKLVLISGGSPLPLSPEWNFKCLPLCLLRCCQPTLRDIFIKRSFHNKGHGDLAYDCAFNIPSHVLKYTMNGQDWSEGNLEFHSWITIPTLLIHGQHDQLVSIQEVNLMRQTIPNSELVVIKDGGHMVMIEKPDEINQLIHNFMRSTLHDSTTDIA